MWKYILFYVFLLCLFFIDVRSTWQLIALGVISYILLSTTLKGSVRKDRERDRLS